MPPNATVCHRRCCKRQTRRGNQISLIESVHLTDGAPCRACVLGCAIPTIAVAGPTSTRASISATYRSKTRSFDQRHGELSGLSERQIESPVARVERRGEVRELITSSYRNRSEIRPSDRTHHPVTASKLVKMTGYERKAFWRRLMSRRSGGRLGSGFTPAAK